MPQQAQPVYQLLAAAKLGGVIEVGHVGQLIGFGQGPQNFLVGVVTNVRRPRKGCPCR